MSTEANGRRRGPIMDESGRTDRRGFLTLGAVAIGGAMAPSLLKRLLDGSGHTSRTEITPQKEQVDLGIISELGNLQLLQREMTGDFELAAKEHHRLRLPFDIIDWHWDPSLKWEGQKKHFKSEARSYTSIDFRNIKVIKTTNPEGKEEIELILPPVKLGGLEIDKIDEIEEDTKNGYFDRYSHRGNEGDKINADPIFNLARNDFAEHALSDQELIRASEAYAKQILADFELKHGFHAVRVRFEDPAIPALETVTVELPEGVTVEKRNVTSDGVPVPFEDIQTILERANAKIETNKQANGGKYTPKSDSIDPKVLMQAVRFAMGK